MKRGDGLLCAGPQPLAPPRREAAALAKAQAVIEEARIRLVERVRKGTRGEGET